LLDAIRSGIQHGAIGAGQWAGGKAGNLGPRIRQGAWMAAGNPLTAAGVGLAGLYGAGNIAFGNASVMGSVGHGIAGGILGAAGGAAWSMGASMIGNMALGMSGSILSANTGTMAKHFGIRGALAGTLFGATLGGNSAPNSFSGF